MCGLVFLYGHALAPEELSLRANNALAKIWHRGPDDGRIKQVGNVIFGHRRLSIIDLAGSHQPMSDPSGRYVLVYNGEIYNFKELRSSLEGKWGFQSQGDTEVILAGLVVYGERFLREMEGMWALALWDNYEKKLILSRDRMGKKPLYYQLCGAGFACASEIPALAQLVDQSWNEDLDSTADFLRYGYYLPGTTAYQGVCEVLPGHALIWRPGFDIQQQPYWSLSFKSRTDDKEKAQQLLREKLVASVKKRMISDVEVGAFLSGGVDSSLIVSIMVNELNISPKTFTIGFDKKSYDERKFAMQVAHKYKTDHYEQCLAEWNPDLLRELVFSYVGQPFSDPSILPTAMASKLAASHVKVVLSGDGGDELFSGYQRYQARVIMQWYTRLPGFFRKNIERIIQAIPEPMSHHSRSLIKKAHLFCEIMNRQADKPAYIAPLMFSHEEMKNLAPDLVGRGHEPPNLASETDLDDVKKMMVADALIYLPQDILLKVDRASMAFSLEARAPFLDSEVVSMAFSMPRQWHRRGASGKRLLRETFSDLLPKNIWRRSKQGFGVPVGCWFKEGLGDEMNNLIGDADMPLNRRWLEALLVSHRENKRDQGLRLWMIYIYLSWKRGR